MLTRVRFSVGIACSLFAGLTAFSQGCGSSEETDGSDTDAGGDASVADTGPGPQPDAAADAPPTPTYSVSGTVTGLAGNLVLSNNGGDAVTVSPSDAGSAAFAFKAKLAKGASYSVAVQTQPQSPSQTCTVTAGSGVIGDADVTNVAVDCTTNSFKVGGTVMGLAGSGLVIQNNAGDDVTIELADAGTSTSFEFPTAIASGSNYAVTVLTQPDGPAQTCVVTGGEGTVAAGNVSTVAINCTTNTYTISGTVTGLEGSGLTLRNNDGPDLVVNSSSFAFPAQVTSGQTYSVTVQADPTSPWQTCTVDASSSGTVTNANVTNVAIHCETKSFSIGGVVKGLAGNHLSFTNNNSDFLEVTPAGGADIPFVFATKVPSGAPYMVAASIMPEHPLQDCVVTNGSGTVQGADVTDIVFTCTTFSAQLLVTLSGLSSGSVVLTNNGGDDLTLSGNGDAVFATALLDASPYDVKVKTNPAGQVCSVTSGSGTFQVGITQVLVTCAPLTPPFSSYTSEGRTVNIYKSPKCADLTANVDFCQQQGQSWWKPKSQADAQALIDNAFAIDSYHTWIQVYGVSTGNGTVGGYPITVNAPGCATYSSGSDWAGFRKWGCSYCDSDTVSPYGPANLSCCWDDGHEYDWFVCEQ